MQEWLTFIGLVIGFYLTVHQLRLLTKQAAAQAYDLLLKIAGNPEITVKRRRILDDENFGNLDPATHIGGEDVQQQSLYGDARQVWTAWNRVAIMVYHGIISLDIVVDLYGGVIPRSWKKFEKWIEYERRQRHDAGYVRFFERLAKDCENRKKDSA